MLYAIAGTLLFCSHAVAAAPVQVFILLGQSNMLGMGHVVGNTNGTLEFAVHNESKCTYSAHPTTHNLQCPPTHPNPLP